MKLDTKGIRYNLFITLLLFAIGIITIVGIVQVALIKPYYRNAKIQNINNYVSELKSNIIDNNSVDEDDVSKLLHITLNNNICSVVFNDSGKVIYTTDSLGEGCLLNTEIDIDDEKLIPINNGDFMINLFHTSNDYSYSITNTSSGQETVLYGVKIENELVNYYVFVNSPVEPIESVTNFIVDQYFLIVIFILIVALIISVYLSNRISKPIVAMEQSANKLASGNYKVVFPISSYSEINHLASSLNDATDKLSKVDELRKDLIANVSHDIKTPLTMIKAYAEMIIDISGDNKLKREEHLNVILKEVDYLDILISDMRELSKMQAGYLVLKKSNFDLVCLVDDTILLFQAILDERGIAIKVNAEDNFFVYADEIKIQQVIYNFISNAIKHSDDTSAIIINVTQNEDVTRLEVIDFGSGILEKDLPYIWDRYYKIDKKFKRNDDKSTGLGLAIVKAILQSHNASFGVTSKVNIGSTFYFELGRDLSDEENV